MAWEGVDSKAHHYATFCWSEQVTRPIPIPRERPHLLTGVTSNSLCQGHGFREGWNFGASFIVSVAQRLKQQTSKSLRSVISFNDTLFASNPKVLIRIKSKSSKFGKS